MTLTTTYLQKGTKMKKVLVTGATGNVGAHVVRELQARGVPVRAFVRNPAQAASRLGGAEIAAGDFADPASIRRALDGVGRVFLTAADGPQKVAHETAVIDAAAAAGVEQIVKLSAMHARGGSPLPAFAWHGEIEAHLARSRVPAVVLRSSFFMTNLLMVAGGVAGAGKLGAPSGSASVSMIDPRDVAAAAAAVLSGGGHDGGAYELTGGEAITFADVARALGEAIGRPVEFVDVPVEAAPEAFKGGGPDWLVTQLLGVFGLIREGAYVRTNESVRALTGRAPRTIADFARDYAEAFGAVPVGAAAAPE
jgi:uncharacterized protein YbjT (DUF2867 family)